MMLRVGDTKVYFRLPEAMKHSLDMTIPTSVLIIDLCIDDFV